MDLEDLAAAARAVYDAPGGHASLAGEAAPGAGAVGHADLAAALGEFATAWRRGADALRTDTVRAGEGLDYTALRYEATDLEVRESMDRIGRGLSS